MTSGVLKRLSDSRADVLVFLTLLAAGVKYVWGLDRVVDVLFYDESLYLLAGVKLAARWLYCPECGPLYAPLYNGWYYLLSFLTNDNLSLYWLNYKVLTIVPVLLTYVLLRRNNVSVLVSAAIAVLVLTSASNIPVWPKPSHMGVVVILLFLIPVSRTRSVPVALALGAGGAFVASYVRPEYFLTFVLLMVTLVGWMIAHRPWKSRADLLFPGSVILGAAAVVAFLGLPVSGSRSLCAFGQHFALYWVAWTGSELHPWVDWQVIFTQNFGQAQGMVDVVRNNPHMFLKHVQYNLMGLANNMGMFFPTHLFGDKLSKVAIVGIIAWLFVVRRDTVRASFRRHRTLLFVVALFLLASLISIITVYPRPHYFVIPVILLTATLAILLSGREDPREKLTMGRGLLISCLILAVTPSPYLVRSDHEQDNVRTIRLIQGLRIARPVNILEAEGGFNIYLGDNYRRIGEADKDRGFGEFIAARDIGVIVSTELLATDLRFKNDPKWKEFLTNWTSFGFDRYAVPDAQIQVFVRKDLLP